jgi:L-amino acid N-acyltransferase YncA
MGEFAKIGGASGGMGRSGAGMAPGSDAIDARRGATVQMTSRIATVADAERIASIYNQGIAERIATFETEPRSTADLEEQIRYKGERFPTIVLEADGDLIAFATAGPYRLRACYGGIAEHSVYVDQAHRGKGAGRFALTALCDEYARLGFWKLLSRIFPENVASLRLHEQCGFRVVGTYERHARLDGQWRDCVIVERLLI